MFRSIRFVSFFPRGRKPMGLLLSVVVLLLSMILSMDIGPVSVPIQYITASLLRQIGFHHVYVPSAYYIIVTQLREPEIVGAMAVGASLSIGGATIQSVFRNPITDPYVTGISSGAALGAVIAIVGGLSFLGHFHIYTHSPYMVFPHLEGIEFIAHCKEHKTAKHHNRYNHVIFSPLDSLNRSQKPYENFRDISWI